MPLPHMARVPGLILGVRWICRRQQMEGEDWRRQDRTGFVGNVDEDLNFTSKLMKLQPSRCCLSLPGSPGRLCVCSLTQQNKGQLSTRTIFQSHIIICVIQSNCRCVSLRFETSSASRLKPVSNRRDEIPLPRRRLILGVRGKTACEKCEIISVTWLFNESHYAPVSLSTAALLPAAFLVPFKVKCTCESETGSHTAFFLWRWALKL